MLFYSCNLETLLWGRVSDVAVFDSEMSLPSFPSFNGDLTQSLLWCCDARASALQQVDSIWAEIARSEREESRPDTHCINPFGRQ